MPATLRYGADSSLTFDVPPEALLADCAAPRGEPLDDPAAAAREALDDPLDFVPLGQATVPGDRVAVALEPGVPRAADVVAGVVHALLAAGIHAEDIAVVRSDENGTSTGDDPRRPLPVETRDAVRLVTHDPDDRDQLGYLAADDTGEPIYFNRELTDADLVIPIGCRRLASSSGYLDSCGGLFPAFSDRATRARYRPPAAVDSAGRWRGLSRQAARAVWWLGITVTVQVVPAGGGEVLHVLAGAPESVERRGRQLCTAAWNYEVPGPADLVVATISGGPEEQTWENVGRALEAAGRVVDEDGAVVLCTDLSTDLGPSLRRLVDTRDVRAAGRRIRKDAGDDALPAARLADALHRTRVYLMSRLNEDLVEQLGMAPVANEGELSRLVGRHGRCILLANAHRAAAVVRESSP